MRKKSARKRSYFTVKSAMTAILRDASGKMHHGILFDGRLLSTLRQKFWLNQGRREVKRVIRRVACQKQRVGPCAENEPIAGRESRCSPTFAHVGTDFAGPLYVKEGSTIQKVSFVYSHAHHFV